MDTIEQVEKFVLCRDYGWDGISVIGVFSSEALAREFAGKMRNSTGVSLTLGLIKTWENTGISDEGEWI